MAAGSSSPAAAALRTPATLAAEAGSQKIALEPGEVAVGGEDLVVGDGVDPAAGGVARRDGLVRDAGSPIRIAVAIVSGLLDPVADHERRRAGRLEAPHPRASLR